MRELDVNRLRVLMEVAHAASIAEAARTLSFTPSALSQQISKLEAELGARLLERRPTGVTLTPVGAVLVDHAERVIGELRQARAAVEAAIEAQPQRLALGSFATAAQVLVPTALAALQHRYPRAELSLVDIEPPEGYGLVTSGDLDMLITHRYPGVTPTPHPGLDRQRLLDDPLDLVLPAGHRLAGGPADRGIGLGRLGEETWISGAPGVPNRVCLETLARQAGVELRVAYESADYHVILALVGAGLGIALVPGSLLAGADRSRVSVRTLRGPAPAREISIVQRRRPTALALELTAFLHTSAAGLTRGPRRGEP
ncbi:LysR family transcriptional regulator [Streptomyces sp. col6]|uniref:LysR substrate-binding domain-containing protein n=1 Tax=Streptomyces sp. col6 TaxID=2478958 RepID=UPI0011CDC37C|nr:LysR substrate-binding domain-containing protein [Streptomyces sp. col6]TXS05013.1 LysR family transcriptional regulator [Streptomyces sp. col6]